MTILALCDKAEKPFLCNLCCGNRATEVKIFFLLPQLTHSGQFEEVLPHLPGRCVCVKKYFSFPCSNKCM